MDGAGSHLFVANSGKVNGVGTISVFAVGSDGALTEVSGSPFPTSSTVATGPSAIAVTSDGSFLYVANSLIHTVTQYDVHVGAGPTDVTLAQQTSYPTGTAPSGALIIPNGGFLYIANSGTTNVSAFAICDTVATSCTNPNQPDGTLTEVANSPFSAGLGPLAMAATSDNKFLFVVDALGNQISQFKISPGTGGLTANTETAISAGANPVSIAIRAGTATIKATGGTKDFVYVANRGAATLSSYAFDSTAGLLSVITPIATGGQPTVVVAK